MQNKILHFYRCVFVIITNKKQVLTVLLSLGGKFDTPVKVTGRILLALGGGGLHPL